MFLVILIMLLFSETARGQMLPVFVALGLVQWLTMARIVRGQVLSLRHREFVLAAELLGASDFAILARHLLPNITGVVIVYATLMVPQVIILESFLSFLGLGVALSWGQLVSDGVAVVNPVRSYWWLLVWPGTFLGLTLLSLNFLGDGLRDALDPKSREWNHGRSRRSERSGRRTSTPARGVVRAVDGVSFRRRARRDPGRGRRVRLGKERDQPLRSWACSSGRAGASPAAASASTGRPSGTSASASSGACAATGCR